MIRLPLLLGCLLLAGCGTAQPGADPDRWSAGIVVHDGQPFHAITMHY